MNGDLEGALLRLNAALDAPHRGPTTMVMVKIDDLEALLAEVQKHDREPLPKGVGSPMRLARELRLEWCRAHGVVDRYDCERLPEKRTISALQAYEELIEWCWARGVTDPLDLWAERFSGYREVSVRIRDFLILTENVDVDAYIGDEGRRFEGWVDGVLVTSFMPNEEGQSDT